MTHSEAIVGPSPEDSGVKANVHACHLISGVLVNGGSLAGLCAHETAITKSIDRNTIEKCQWVMRRPEGLSATAGDALNLLTYHMFDHLGEVIIQPLLEHSAQHLAGQFLKRTVSPRPVEHILGQPVEGRMDRL